MKITGPALSAPYQVAQPLKGWAVRENRDLATQDRVVAATGIKTQPVLPKHLGKVLDVKV